MLQITKSLLSVVLLKYQVLLAFLLPPLFPSLLFITYLRASHFFEWKWFIRPASLVDVAFTSVYVSNNSILYTSPGSSVMCRGLCGGTKMNQASSEPLRDSPSSRRAAAWIPISKTQRSHEKGKVLASYVHCYVLRPTIVPREWGLFSTCLGTEFVAQRTNDNNLKRDKGN